MGWGLGNPSKGEGAQGSSKTLQEIPVAAIPKGAVGKGVSSGIFGVRYSKERENCGSRAALLRGREWASLPRGNSTLHPPSALGEQIPSPQKPILAPGVLPRHFPLRIIVIPSPLQPPSERGSKIDPHILP